MPYVEFMDGYTTNTREEDRETFEAGKVYELSESSAQHHVSRGRAKVVEKPKPETKTTPKKADAK